MSFNISPRIITDSLVLYLDAINPKSYPGSGTTWSDISRGGNNGTLVNGPTYSSANGGSIVFDGTSDYVNISTITAAGSFSMECVFNSQNNTNKCLLLCDIYSPRISLRDNVINVYYNTVGTGDIIFTFSSIPTNKFNHLMITYDPVNNHTCYLNGITGSRTSNNTALNAVPSYTYIQIGNSAGSETYFSGSIGYLRVYNRALTSDEVLRNYNATKYRYGV